MKPVTGSSSRSRPPRFFPSSQLELFAGLGDSPAATPPAPPAVSPAEADLQPAAEIPPPPRAVIPPVTAAERAEPEFPAEDEPLPDDATDFDPAQLESLMSQPDPDPIDATKPALTDPTPEEAPAAAAEEPVPPAPPEPTLESESPPPTQASLDIFESDPFFNPPPADTRTESTPLSEVQARPVPAETVIAPVEPTAEERLLNTIVGQAAEAVPVPAPVPVSRKAAVRQPRPPVQALPPDEDAAPGLSDVQAGSESRLAALENELAEARRKAAQEAALRQDESTRHAAAEQEWNRRLAALKREPAATRVLDQELTARHSPAPLLIGVVVAGLCATIIAFFVGRALGLKAQAPDSVPPLAAPAAIEPRESPITPPPAPPVAPVRTAPAWPSLTGAGFKTSQTDQEMTLVFNYGVFSRGTELSDAARQDLQRIANAFKPSAARFKLEVEGHTDNSPVGAGRPYGGNRELGLSRARAAADYLTTRCGLPAASVAVVSAGDANPPHSNATAEGRQRNRTVVLRVRPATGP